MHIFCAERRHKLCVNFVHRRDLCVQRKDKKRTTKKDKETLQWQSVIRSHHHVRPQIEIKFCTRGASSSGLSSKFQVSSKSVEWFPRCEGSKFALSDSYGRWLIQQLVLERTKIRVCRMLLDFIEAFA